MPFRVSGKNIDLGEALRERISSRVSDATAKYFDGGYSGHVTVGKDGFGFRTELVVHLDSGVVLEVEAFATDAYASADQAALRIEKRLRRYKRRLNDRHEQTAHAIRAEDAAYTIFVEPEPEVEEHSDAPLVIAEMRVDVPEATVSDAVMMLDLRNTNALLFKNAGTGTYNMVYRRGDGSIGWVEPS